MTSKQNYARYFDQSWIKMSRSTGRNTIRRVSFAVHLIPEKSVEYMLFSPLFCWHMRLPSALAIAGIGNQAQLLITAALNLVVATWLTIHIRTRKSTDSHEVMQAAG